MTEMIADYVSQLESEGKVCPMPMRWNELWEMLPGRPRQGSGWNPPALLILAAWNFTSDEEKHERFLLHLNWADKHGVAVQAIEFLQSLTDEDWHIQ